MFMFVAGNKLQTGFSVGFGSRTTKKRDILPYVVLQYGDM